MFRKGCFVFFALTWILCTVSLASAIPAKATLRTVDDIEYSMPPGWVANEMPGAKAYYVLMYQGNPVGELYLTKEPLFGQKSPSAILQEGLRKNSAVLQGYQPVETENITLSGIDAVMHDFFYYPPESPVPFTGRIVVLVVNNAAYTLFFNTTTGVFPMLKGAFGEIIASVRPVRPVRKTKAEPRRVTKEIFSFKLAPGWRDTDDPQGAEYRYYDETTDDTILASFLFFGRSMDYEDIALLAMSKKTDPLQALLEGKVAAVTTEGEYAPLGTQARTVAGCDALVHDFSITKDGRRVIRRWCVVAVKEKPNAPYRIFAPAIYDFTFVTTEIERFDEVKGILDAVLDSMTLVQPLPPFSPAPPFADMNDERIFRSPTGSFIVTLPKGSKKDPIERFDPAVPGICDSYTYTVDGKKDTTILLSVFYSSLDGEDALDNLVKELDAQESGKTNWNVQGRSIPVGLYAARDGQALVTALFADDNLLIAVLLPKREYAGAQGWIKELITGVHFE